MKDGDHFNRFGLYSFRKLISEIHKTAHTATDCKVLQSYTNSEM